LYNIKSAPVRFLLNGLEYVGLSTLDEKIFINLTDKDIVLADGFTIYCSGHIARLTNDGHIIGLPQRSFKNVYYIVEKDVYEASGREDLCTKVTLSTVSSKGVKLRVYPKKRKLD